MKSTAGPCHSMVKGRIDIVDVFLAQAVLGKSQTFAKSLEVYDLPLAQEPDSIVDVWVIAEAENIVVGNASFLLCCELVRTTFFMDVIEITHGSLV